MSALLLPQSSMAWCQERPLSQTTSPKGESESVEVSVQLPQPCETLPRRPTCFSPDPDFQGNLQSGGAGRGWKHSSQGSELIKGFRSYSLFCRLYQEACHGTPEMPCLQTTRTGPQAHPMLSTPYPTTLLPVADSPCAPP